MLLCRTIFLLKDDYIKINNLANKWKCSEEDEDEIEVGNNAKPSLSVNFLAPAFHRDSSNRLSMQFSGESSGFVF